jgi:branched-chain amino acid transport system ATP-binding protein
MTMLLEVQRLRSGYGRLPVLFDVDFRVDAGELVALVGANGAGKSTPLKTILGLVPADGGEVVFDGRRVTSGSAAERFARGMSLSPEGRRIFKFLTVAENLTAGSYGVDAGVVSGQLERCYSMFPILEERKTQRGGLLSGGEQQMLAVSRALMSNPRLLLVDELSMGLAPLVVTDLLESLRALCAQGLAVIVVDQFASRLLDHADRACVMEKGQISFDGVPAEASRYAESAAGLGYEAAFDGVPEGNPRPRRRPRGQQVAAR